MKRFPVSDTLEADCTVEGDTLHGHLYHVRKNVTGSGKTLTPVAYFFGTHPEFVEGYHRYWRIDCFFREHPLSPDPFPAGESLVDALKGAGLCADPLWLSVHRSEELKGKAYGDVFED